MSYLDPTISQRDWKRMMSLYNNCNGLQRIATDCNGLQRIAADCNGLQRIATDCNGLQRIAIEDFLLFHSVKCCRSSRLIATLLPSAAAPSMVIVLQGKTNRNADNAEKHCDTTVLERRCTFSGTGFNT